MADVNNSRFSKYNAIIVTILLGVLSFVSVRLWDKVDIGNTTLIRIDERVTVLKSQMDATVPRPEYLLELNAVKSRIAATEVEIEKLKKQRAYR